MISNTRHRRLWVAASLGISSVVTSGLQTPTWATDGRFTGDVVQTPFGQLQVEIVISNNKLEAPDSVQFPQSDPQWSEINRKAVSALAFEALSAQSANIQGISGASYTSQGWISSLASAIAKANWKSTNGLLFPTATSTAISTPKVAPWEPINNNDGFSKTFTVTRDSEDSDTDEYGNSITHTLEIQCTNKKLGLLLYSSSPGIFPKTNLSNLGTGSFKVDTGKVTTFSYVAINDQSGVSALYPKVLTSAILKAKKTFSFKILSGVQGPTVANFVVADIKKYVSKFKSLGCGLN
jgi:hypothetical protein